MAKTTKKTAAIVADICLYGTRNTGAGYLGCRWPHGQSFGTGDPVKDRTFSEAIWRALDELRKAGTPDGLVRIFDTCGERMAVVGLNEATIYGGLRWEKAPVYTISAEALIAASAQQ